MSDDEHRKISILFAKYLLENPKMVMLTIRHNSDDIIISSQIHINKIREYESELRNKKIEDLGI